jgi:hypothetical protein
MDYFNARSLQLRTGRFNRPDPLFAGAMGNPQGWNRYAYVGNNPLKYVDPTGNNLEIVVNVVGRMPPPDPTATLDPTNQWASWAGYKACGTDCDLAGGSYDATPIEESAGSSGGGVLPSKPVIPLVTPPVMPPTLPGGDTVQKNVELTMARVREVGQVKAFLWWKSMVQSGGRWDW